MNSFSGEYEANGNGFRGTSSREKTVSPLKVVVFTAGELSPVDYVLLSRLADDRLVELVGIVVDQFRQRRKNIIVDSVRNIRRHGISWLCYKISAKILAVTRRSAMRVYDWTHVPVHKESGYDDLSRGKGVPVYFVADINNTRCHETIRALRPQLGVIIGGRILRHEVISIPEWGSINIHKRKVPEYRGGGRVGYWELMANETSTGVTIHYATAKVDQGPVLAEATIQLDECETLSSIQIKSDILGAKLYHQTIRDFALGKRAGTPQDSSAGRTYRSDGEYAEHLLERRLERKAVQMMPFQQRSKNSSWARYRVFVQYLLVLPYLLHVRKRLSKGGRAPILIFYYHLVANRAANHMSIPLELFVRQIEFLRRYYEVVSVDEAARRVRSGSNKQIAVALTFDDGYRDNDWVIEYLKYFDIPACFFISVGHVQDQLSFEHDVRRGFKNAAPMTPEQCGGLTKSPLCVGSHGIFHEDFGKLDIRRADLALLESKQRLQSMTGETPRHFSFPIGIRGINITKATFERAKQHYELVHSAYGGYNFPCRGQRHLLRIGEPEDMVSLLTSMDGYTGFTNVLKGDGWSLKTHEIPPYRQ